MDNVKCTLNCLLADGGNAMNKLLVVTVLAALLALSKSSLTHTVVLRKWNKAI